MKFPLWRRRRREEELEEEIQSHLRMAIRDRVERGESAKEAETAARREFGNVGLIKEATRAMWGFGALETIRQDARYGARMLLKQPGFTLMAILTLALGIGANTAIFSFVNSVLLRPPMAAQPEQLLRILKREGGNFFSYPNYRDIAEGTPAFSMLAAHSEGQLNLGQGEATERVHCEFVTGNFFPALGIPAAVGRTFGTETADASGQHPIVVMGHGYWRRRFGADARLVGQTIMLNGLQFTIAGVMPEGFRGTWPVGIAPEIWAPITMLPQVQSGADFFNDRAKGAEVSLFGRLKPGISQAQAQAEVSLISKRLAETYPDVNRDLEGAKVYPMSSLPEVFARVIRGFIALVTVISGLVLLLVCANAANLLLSRAVLRRQEVAIRLALGASRRRLIRQLLTESVMLALAGGAAGCLLAFWVTSLLRSFRPPTPVPIEFNVTLDSGALGFTLAVSTLAGLVFGLAPAWHATKVELVPMLKDDRRGGAGRRSRFSARNLLVISQVAVSLLLLICAALFTRSLQNVHNIAPGFETDHMLTVSVDISGSGYDEARGRLLYRRLLDQFEQVPGVRQVSLAQIIPLKEDIATTTDVAVEGYDAPGGDYPWMFFNTVGPRYFETMGIPILAGREFTRQDAEGAPLVVIVNETMARRFWPGPQAALGRRLRLAERPNVLSPYYEVVGVVKDIKYRSVGEAPRPFFYVPALQNYRGQIALHLRTTGDPGSMRSAVRDRVLALDKNLLVEVATMRENLVIAFLPARVAATVFGLVGLFGLSLAVVGIYGVISYVASQRIGEIGLRMALGAQSRDILRLVIGHGLKLALIGVLLGTALALAITRFLSSLLVGVSAADPLTFLTVPLLLTTVAIFACWIPARRATKVDPMIALRCE
ncbi:MAG TPA: ABC transporter permease [Blastocatellia bacterium]|jgi:predicted permease|nr:ABC transporter permease [Blastocatellia bacterium]